jgi:hypothetical protein
MSSDFFTQATNLLAQQLAALKGEEIYAETSCMNPEQRQLIGILRGLEQVIPKAKAPITKIIPLISMIGKANWERSELTDLGLRVGQRNYDEVTDTEIRPDDKLQEHSD